LARLPEERGQFSNFADDSATAKTQLTGVVGALAVALLLLAAPNLLQHLPSAALAAVVIASAIGLIEVTDLIRIFRIQRWEFWLSMTAITIARPMPGMAPKTATPTASRAAE
jgi:MFS superfamily sulfate permease-like transporter